MVLNHSIIIGFQAGYEVSVVSFGGNSLEEFGIHIPKFNTMNGKPFLPVVFLMLKEPKQMFFENGLKVSLLSAQHSAISNVGNLKESFVDISNGCLKPWDFLAPLTEGMSQVFKFLTETCSNIIRLTMFEWFTPSVRDNIHEARVSNPVVLKTE